MIQLKQYVIKYKPSGRIISFYNTLEGAFSRLKYISDSNVFGVFEVQTDFKSSTNMIGVVIKSTGTVLNAFYTMDEVSENCKVLIENGFCEYKALSIKTVSKEIKEPKPEVDEFGMEC